MNTGFIWGIRSRNGRESYNNLNTVNARRSRKTKGFTLVELIVVLVILAILAAIAVPTLIAFIDKGREKKVQLNAQRALSATQTALSDIYADAGNRFTPAKREATRNLAAVDSDDNGKDTEFTVWTENRLWDGKTTAITENIGSYTISKALYCEPGNSYYVAYDGSDWTVFDTKEKATEFLDISNAKGYSKDLTDNVIYVWDWQQDYAYIPGLDPDDPIGGGEGDSVVKVLTLRLPSETLGNVFFSPSGYNNNSGKESISIVFWKDENGNISCTDWRVVNNVDTFKTDNTHSYWINTVNSEDKTYQINGWQLEDGNPLPTQFASDLVGSYIFSNTFENINRITLVAQVGEGDIVSYKATMGKTKLQGLINNSSVTQIQGIRRVTEGLAGNKYDAQTFQNNGVPGAVKVDRNEAADERGVIYAWVSTDGWIEWWSDATTVYLPKDSASFFQKSQINKSIISFDFSEFDVARVEKMNNMFHGQTELSNVKIGSNFYANSLENTQSMFDACSKLATVDMQNFNAGEGTLKNVSYMFKKCSSLTKADFGPGFETRNVTNFEHMFDMDNPANTAMTSLNVSNFHTNNAQSLERIFYNCAGVSSLNCSLWNLEKCTSLYSSFQGMSNLKTLSIGTDWNLQACTTMQSAFEGCANLSGQDFGNLQTSERLTNLWATFSGCKALTRINLSGVKAENVVVMDRTFYNCSNVESINLTGEGWNTTNLRYMTETFKNCTGLTSLDISNWDLRNVEIMDHTFADCSAMRGLYLPSGEKCHLNSCKTLLYAFERCKSLQGQTFRDLKVSEKLGQSFTYVYYKPPRDAVGSLEGVFSECSSLTNLEIADWNVVNVKNMNKSFNKCSALTWLDINNWDTQNVTVMSNTFSDCTSLDALNLKNWDLNKVTNMKEMFKGDSSLLYIRMGEGWNLSACTNMQATFEGCSKLTQNFKEIRTTNNLTNISYTFKGMNGVVNLDLRGFNTQGVTSECKETFVNCSNLRKINATAAFTIPKEYHNTNMFAGCNALVGGNGTDYDTNPNNKDSAQFAWLDGEDRSDLDDDRGYFSARTEAFMKQTAKEWLKANKLNYNANTINSFMHADNVTEAEVTAKSGVQDLKDTGTDVPIYFWKESTTNNRHDIRWWSPADVVFIHPDSAWMFYGYENATTIDLTGLDFSRMKNYSEFFYNDKNLTSLTLGEFSTTSATDMNAMFRECQKLTEVNIKGWDTSNVTDMRYMFYNCNKLTEIDMTGLDTSKITSTDHMFFNCQSATKILTSRWDTSNVTEMSYMFDRCIKLAEVDVTSFDTRKVTTMENMFSNSIWNNNTAENKVLKTLDLSSFSTESLTNIKNMFTRQRALTTVYVNPEEWSDAENQFWMGSQNAQGPGWTAFKGCNVIKGAQGTSIPANLVNNNNTETSGVFARVDEPEGVDLDGNEKTGEKGYFTDIALKPTE